MFFLVFYYFHFFVPAPTGRSADAARNQHKMMGRPRAVFKSFTRAVGIRHPVGVVLYVFPFLASFLSASKILRKRGVDALCQCSAALGVLWG